METLQNDEINVENPELDDSDVGAESAPDNDDSESVDTGAGTSTSENKDESPEPERFVKRINQKHRELMEEKRRNEELQRRLQELEQVNEPKRPEIPPLPDPYDDDFDEQVRRRDAAIAAAAAFDARKAQEEAQKQRQMQESLNAQNAVLQRAVTTYAEKAAKLGIKPEELAVAGQVVASYGVNDDLVHFILQDDQGPAITSFLAENPEHIEAVNALGPLNAVSYIEKRIRPNLTKTSKSNNAHIPEPPDTLSGSGATAKQRGPVGAKYE